MPSAPTGPGRERLLVVEDDAAQRVGLQKLLTSWGFAVDVAEDGREALEKIALDRPAIVLSDLVMPNLGGLELLRALTHACYGFALEQLGASQGQVVQPGARISDF